MLILLLLTRYDAILSFWHDKFLVKLCMKRIKKRCKQIPSILFLIVFHTSYILGTKLIVSSEKKLLLCKQQCQK